MQRVTYTSPRGVTTVFAVAPPYIFEKVSGTGALDAQLVTSAPAGRDGSSFAGLYLGNREVTVNVHIHGATDAQRYALRQKLIERLSPLPNAQGRLGTLTYTNDHGTWTIGAAPKTGPNKFTKSGAYYTSLSLVFLCPWPYWQGQYPEYASMAYMGGGFSFPVEFPRGGAVHFGSQGYSAVMDNDGDAPAPVLIRITGPATKPRITKNSTGEFVEVRRQLFEGDVLEIYTHPAQLSVVITHEDGTQEQAIGYINLSSTFFLLDPGPNALDYSSGDATTTATVTLSAYGQFGGV